MFVKVFFTRRGGVCLSAGKTGVMANVLGRLLSEVCRLCRCAFVCNVELEWYQESEKE